MGAFSSEFWPSGLRIKISGLRSVQIQNMAHAQLDSSAGEDIGELVIYDKSLIHGCNAVFAPNGSLAVHALKKQEIKTQSEIMFHEISSRSSLYNQYTRKLVNECHGVFLSATKIQRDCDEATLNQNLKKISRKYHSVLLACMEDLHDATASGSLTEEELVAQNAMFAEIELLWSLIETLLFDIHSRTLVVYRLVKWIQWHFTDPEKMSEEILECDEPWEHPKYWETILQFVLQGNMFGARSLLRLHKSKTRDDFLSMDELLRKMPTYFVDAVMSWNEFHMRWRHWQEECHRRLEEGEFSGVDGLGDVCRVLCGIKEVFSEKSYLCCTWFHLLISMLLYTDPCVSASKLGQLAKTYYANATTEPSLLDDIILAVMELDVINFLEKCSNFHDDRWFGAHMTDLISRGNFVRPSSSVSHLNTVREWFLVNYAASLMSHQSLWQIGPDYLDHCETNGRDYLELWLERVPLDSEGKAQKVLCIARKRKLSSLVKKICQVMTRKAIRNGMYGTALSWVVESKDVMFATEIADKWIKEYSDTGKFECFEVLKNLGASMLVSDKLTFLGKYCEFHQLYEDKEYKAAASLLVGLLSSGLVPQHFRIRLLIDALPLLEYLTPVFTMEETAQLMSCLQDIIDGEMKEAEKAAVMKHRKFIRLALARNYARAFIHENSAS